ncbi:MAG: hypothetical protein KAH32_08415 [Chlamydiia bacterium]|nr:hypothetical protein [Chlamydiia bacterium]
MRKQLEELEEKARDENVKTFPINRPFHFNGNKMLIYKWVIYIENNLKLTSKRVNVKVEGENNQYKVLVRV